MSHQQRIKDELIAAGFSRYALLKAESRRLPTVIHEDEHIMAAVYGRIQNGSAMLVATNLRVIYLDVKPLFKIMDEISYEVVSGITHDQQAGFGHIVLHSRIGDYAIRYANPTCASRFADYIERARIDIAPNADNNSPLHIPAHTPKATQKAIIPDEVYTFLRAHELGVLATMSRQQEPHMAAVYYAIGSDGIIRILTKTGTEKSRNITGNHIASFLVYDETQLQTAHIQAYAEVEPDSALRQATYEIISRERVYDGKLRRPPVTDLQQGSFTVLRLTPTAVQFTDFNK